MKVKKNGWSTAEMLLLSGGLLLALFVAVYFISTLYGSFDLATGNKIYNDLENELASAAKKYVDSSNVSVIQGEKLTLKFLQANNYMTELKDDKGRSCDGYVRVNVVSGINQYIGYVSCPDYESQNYNN